MFAPLLPTDGSRAVDPQTAGPAVDGLQLPAILIEASVPDGHSGTDAAGDGPRA